MTSPAAFSPGNKASGNGDVSSWRIRSVAALPAMMFVDQAAAHERNCTAGLRATGQVEVTVQRACAELLDRIDEVAVGQAALILREEPYYRAAMTIEQLAEHITPNTTAALELLDGRARVVVVDPGATGRLRAEQGYPQAVVQRAYRLGTAYLWEQLVRLLGDDDAGRKALVHSVSNIWSVLDELLEALSTAYREVEIERARQDERIREAALSTLFYGAQESRDNVNAVEALHLPRTGSFVVVATERRHVGDDRAVAAVERTLKSMGVRSVWRSETDAALGLVVLTRRYGLDRLVDYLRTVGLGRVGVSVTFVSISETRPASAHARLARDAATPGSSEVVRYEESRIAALLAAQAELADSLVTGVLGPLSRLNEADQAILLQTLRAWFETNGSPMEAAKVLHCHHNTVRYRLGKLSQLTGRDLNSPIDVAYLYLALEGRRILPDAADEGRLCDKPVAAC